jgi:hypothetical protein
LKETEAQVHAEEVRRADAERQRRLAETARFTAPRAPAPAPSPDPDAGTLLAPPPVPGPAPVPEPPAPWVRFSERDGGVGFSGWFDAERGRQLVDALHRLTRPKGPERTRYAERQALALFDAVTGSPGPPGGAPVPRTTAVVHCHIGQLTGATIGDEVATVQGVGPVTVEVLRRLLCDARITLRADTGDGCGLNVATIRQPPLTLTNEVRRRDGTCRFPDCSGRHDLVTHHIVHWADGGPTVLENLVTLCAEHHHCHHDRGWTISGDPNATLTFTSPTGQRFGTRPVPGWKPPTRSRTTPRRE